MPKKRSRAAARSVVQKPSRRVAAERRRSPHAGLGRASTLWPAKRPPLSRVTAIIADLRAGRRSTASEFARQHEVSVRTIYRDLDFLRDRLQAPLEYDTADRTWRLTDETFEWPLLNLTRGELMALFFAEKVLSAYRGTPYERDLERAFAKFADSFPEQVTVDPGRLETYLSVDLGAISAPDPEIFSAVLGGLTTRHRIRIRYSSMSSGDTTQRVVEPYHVYNLRGNWYLAAHDHRRSEVRDFALQRIEAVKILDERYGIDSAWSFEDYMANSLGIEKGGKPVKVTIRFAPDQARRIREKEWHPTMAVKDRRDGGCDLSLSVAGLDEVKRWVLRFGDGAEVLRPKRLRESVAAELKAMGRMYA